VVLKGRNLAANARSGNTSPINMQRKTVQATVMGTCLALCLALCLVLTGSASEVSESQRWQETSEQGNFVVDLIATDAEIKLSEFLSWQLVIRDAYSNQGVAPVRVVIGGGMPAHGHGLPTQPEVTGHTGDGHYQLEGLMFNMAGQWQLVLQIGTKKILDRVVFDLTIQH